MRTWNGAPTPDFPPQELREEPANPVDTMRKEMRMYPDGPSLRLCITGLQAKYDQTPLVQDFEKVSRMMKLSQLVLHESAPRDDDLVEDFYAGEVWATYAMLYSVEAISRMAVLTTPLFAPAKAGAKPIDPLDETSRKALSELDAMRTSGWQSMFNYILDEEHQSVLLDSVVLYTEDLPEPDERTDNFLAGYLFAATNIRKSLSSGNNYSRVPASIFLNYITPV